jgi:NADP-dependent 3-hydroxy acid dehydrogenase YdfG
MLIYIMETIYNIIDLTDNDLKQLMEKYREKQARYDLMINEATDRNNQVINRIYQEQVKRLISKNVEMFKEARMNISKN